MWHLHLLISDSSSCSCFVFSSFCHSLPPFLRKIGTVMFLPRFSCSNCKKKSELKPTIEQQNKAALLHPQKINQGVCIALISKESFQICRELFLPESFQDEKNEGKRKLRADSVLTQRRWGSPGLRCFDLSGIWEEPRRERAPELFCSH